MKLKVTASPRGGVESNRRRMDSPQDDEPDSAACAGEPARVGEAWTREGPIGRAEVTAKATFGAHDVGGGGMSGRQSGVSEEACSACERRTGVRALIVLQR
jgi:hypothetical protein